ncbi:MAG TPA: heme-binding protein, partial [Methylophilaceae bacterium]|nr:heme-binding protein [Methylophilaceae bacterium]
MKKVTKKVVLGAIAASTFAVAGSVNAACSDISHAQLQTALSGVVGTAAGFGLPMWATFVDETGRVCAVATSGDPGKLASRTEWLGSRVISAQKANTANAFSLNGVSISSGALYAGVQPGASLFGLSDSNPVDASRAYKGNPVQYGKKRDPLVGKRIGGVNTFGGGLAVYKDGVKIGALGVSGDTSCTDHGTVWALRTALGLDTT